MDKNKTTKAIKQKLKYDPLRRPASLFRGVRQQSRFWQCQRSVWRETDFNKVRVRLKRADSKSRLEPRNVCNERARTATTYSKRSLGNSNRKSIRSKSKKCSGKIKNVGKPHLHNKPNFGAGGLAKWSLEKSKNGIKYV